MHAGFTDIRLSSSSWTYADAESCRWLGGVWADRCEHSALGEQMVDYGLADRAEVLAIASAWREWSEKPDAYFSVPHGELLARA